MLLEPFVMVRAAPARSSSLALESLPARAISPVHAYYARLGPVSRRGAAVSLARAAKLLTGGRASAEELPWAALRYEHVLALRQALTDLHYAPATIQHTLACVRGVLREAWRLGQVSADLLQRVSDVPAARGRRSDAAGRMLTRAELRALIHFCRRGGADHGRRDLALLALLYGCGLRRSEACTVQLSDLRSDGVRVIGKGNIERLQPVPPKAALWLRQWLQVRGRWGGPLLCTVDPAGHVLRHALASGTIGWLLGDLARRAGVRAFSAHDLRRSYVSQLLDAGVELRAVQQLAGHRQVTTTQRYDRRQLRSLAAAAARLPL